MWFFEWFRGLGDLTQFFLVIGAAAAIISVAAIAFESWRRVRVSELRAGLTRRMLDCGMSADEILRVLASTKIDSPNERTAGASDPEVLIVEVLTGNHYEAGDVRRILSAARIDGRVDDSTYGVVKSLAESWAEADNIVDVLEARRQAKPTPRGSESAV